MIQEGEIKDGNICIAKFLSCTNDTIEFHDDWNQLHDIIDIINGLGKEYNFSIFKTYCALSVERGSGKVYKDFSFAHSEYVTSEQTSREAVFKLIVKFVKWYTASKFNVGDELEFYIYGNSIKGKFLGYIEPKVIKIEVTFDSSEVTDIGCTVNCHESFLV